MTVALEATSTSQHDVESEEADGVAGIKGLSFWNFPPLIGQRPGCIVVNLDVGTENVKVEGWSEKSSRTSPPLPIGNE